MVRFEGREYVVERVAIDELGEWRDRLGLVYAGRVGFEGESWPPMLRFEYDDPGTHHPTF